MKQDNRQTQLILCLFGIFPVVWLGLLILSGGVQVLSFCQCGG